MNRTRIFRFLPLAAFLAVFASLVFSPSCANTTEAPKGGPKDTIPPVLTKVVPVPGTVGVPVHGTSIAFTFNEYVNVKEPKAIYLSPPQTKTPKFKIKGRSVVVYFEEDLLPNTTYTLDISGAIVDNNEGNAFPGYTTVFSTGDSIDSMFVCGTVRNCTDLKPISGATVMLYKDASDSAVFLSRPYASSRTDAWGYF
ncbi:MAG: Ig-like domain-containing protein, partial [Candidatus Cryptobacteroides sp.]